jgi:hypothetical protein
MGWRRRVPGKLRTNLTLLLIGLGRRAIMKQSQGKGCRPYARNGSLAPDNHPLAERFEDE